MSGKIDGRTVRPGCALSISDRKNMLMSMAESMLSLADRITDNGEPLSPEDKGLLRIATMPAFNENLSMLKFQFIDGNIRDMEHTLEQLVMLADI